jgi:hypothetical protein
MNSVAIGFVAVAVIASVSGVLWARILRRRREFRAEASIAAAITSGTLYLLIAYIDQGDLGGLWPVVFIGVTLIAGGIAFAVISRVFQPSSQEEAIDA